MSLGVCYNVFDGEELLEASIRSVRSVARWIVVVYQRQSNFGEAAPPGQMRCLERLRDELRLVDELVRWEPRAQFSDDERLVRMGTGYDPDEVGGSHTGIGTQFFNELDKRNAGREHCVRAGCSWVLSMDCDEFYRAEQLSAQLQRAVREQWDASACRMRTYYREPTWELVPPDELNWVTFLCRADLPFRIAVPLYPALCDPTRRVEGARRDRFVCVERNAVEMHHMSFVRRDIRRKMRNVSNRINYGAPEAVERFCARWDAWTPADGVVHPHPHIGSLFSGVLPVENWFHVDLRRQCRSCSLSRARSRCIRCRRARYCSERCQTDDWPRHQRECMDSGRAGGDGE